MQKTSLVISNSNVTTYVATRQTFSFAYFFNRLLIHKAKISFKLSPNRPYIHQTKHLLRLLPNRPYSHRATVSFDYHPTGHTASRQPSHSIITQQAIQPPGNRLIRLSPNRSIQPPGNRLI